jgi:hypothetical protein
MLSYVFGTQSAFVNAWRYLWYIRRVCCFRWSRTAPPGVQAEPGHGARHRYTFLSDHLPRTAAASRENGHLNPGGRGTQGKSRQLFNKSARKGKLLRTANFQEMNFQIFNQLMHFYFRISVQLILHMFRPRHGHHQGYIDKFTSLFTGPFGIITELLHCLRLLFTLAITGIHNFFK